MNSTELLAEVKRLWLGPTTALLQTTNADILAHLDRVIEEELCPRLIDIDEEYLIQETRLTLSSGVNKYRIPDRAYNTQIREVSWRTSATASPVDLDWIDRAEKNYYPQTGQPASLYLEGDFLVLQGEPTGVIDVAFPFRPGKLVDSDNWRVVATVTPATKQITLTAAAPAAWTTSDTFDVHSAKSSHEIKDWDMGATVVSGTNMTFTPEIDGSVFGRHAIEVGDYVCLAGKAAGPQIPQGLHGVAAHGAVCRIAQSQADREYYQLVKAEYAQNFELQIRNLDHRVSQRQVLVNHNSRFRRWGSSGFGRGRRRFF